MISKQLFFCLHNLFKKIKILFLKNLKICCTKFLAKLFDFISALFKTKN